MAKHKRVPRRGNGEGSIFQRKDGMWCAVVTIGKDEDGKLKRKYIYASTRSEVARKLTEMTGKIHAGLMSSTGEKLVGETMREWLMVFKQSAVAARTFEAHIRNFRIHIEPLIGNMKINEVTPLVIQRHYNELFLKRLSVASVKKIKHLMGQFFEYCVDNDMIMKNPVVKTKLRTRDRKIYSEESEYKAIPKDVRIEFLQALNSNEFLKPLCMTAMFAGLRAGELLALKWKDVDFHNRTIKVERGLSQIPIFNEDGTVKSRRTVVSETKTMASVREVPIPEILVNALEEWKKVQWVKEKVYGSMLIDKECFVFSNNDGSFRTYSGTRMIFERFVKRHGLEKYNIHFHTLRHTYSNMLFEMGENPKVIQMLLGHKDVTTTITTYNSVDQSYYRQATDKLNKQFNTEVMNEAKEIKREEPKQTYNYQQEDERDNEQKEIEMLERLLEEKKARRQKDDFEM